MTDCFKPTVRGILRELQARRDRIAQSLNSLDNPNSEYGQDHTRVLVLLDELIAQTKEAGR